MKLRMLPPAQYEPGQMVNGYRLTHQTDQGNWWAANEKGRSALFIVMTNPVIEAKNENQPP